MSFHARKSYGLAPLEWLVFLYILGKGEATNTELEDQFWPNSTNCKGTRQTTISKINTKLNPKIRKSPFEGYYFTKQEQLAHKNRIEELDRE